MDSYDSGAGSGLIAVAVILYIVVFAGLYVWTALSLNAVFRKTGEPGWAGWVPFYNTALLLKLGGFSPFLIFLVLVPYLGGLAIWVLFIVAAYRINGAFGYREGAGVGMTILAALLGPVWSSVLGWGSARWVGPDPRLRAAGPGGVPGGGFAPAYPQPGSGHPDVPGQPGYGAGTGYAPAPGAFAPAAPAGYVPPPPAPAGYAPPAAPEGYVPPASPFAPAPAPAAPVPPADVNPFQPTGAVPPRVDDNPFAIFGEPVDEDLEGVDDPVPGAAPSPLDVDTVADSQPPVAPAPAAFAPPAPVSAAPPAPPASVSAAPAPTTPVAPPVVDDVPAADEVDPADPWAPPTPVPAARRSPMPEDAADFSDTSAEVSAVAGAPMAGGPMSARSSVSALRGEPELPDAESAFDETIIAPRRRTEFMLTPPLGTPIRITETVLILGRRPAADPAYPQAQLIDISDDTRTVSKTHARLELAADRWTITDLDSTNGIVLVDADGTETEVPAGGSQLVGERFLLGDAELRLTRGKD